MKRALVSFLFFFSAPFFCAPLKAEIFVLQSGEILEGNSEKIDGYYIVELKDGNKKVLPADQIKEIKWPDTPEGNFNARLAVLDAKDASGHYALGLWCREQGLTEQAQMVLKKAIEIDPDHRLARKELGFRRLGDRWLEETDYMREMGMVKHGDKWISVEERSLITLREANAKAEALIKEAEKKAKDIAKESDKNLARRETAKKIRDDALELLLKTVDRRAFERSRNDGYILKRSPRNYSYSYDYTCVYGGYPVVYHNLTPIYSHREPCFYSQSWNYANPWAGSYYTNVPLYGNYVRTRHSHHSHSGLSFGYRDNKFRVNGWFDY